MSLALPSYGAAVLTPKGSALLLRATFTAADGTALGSYQPEIGPKFAMLAFTATIQSNTASLVSNGLAATDLGRADILWAGDVQAKSSGNVGLAFRAVDSNNYWLADIEQAGGALKLWEVVAGGFTQRATASQATVNGTFYRLVVQAIGTAIAVYFNGALVLSYGSAATGLTATKHGLYNGVFDNVAGWAPGGVAVPGGVV